MNYPLDLSFKIFAIANQIYVRDSSGHLVCYVKQKVFSWKDSITVFADEEQTKPLFTINADSILDFNARFHFADTNGTPMGSVKRQGARSLWRCRYDLLSGETPVMHVQEENPWVKVFDAILLEIPIVGLFTTYFLNPRYLIARSDGTPVMRLKKHPSFFDRRFRLENLGEMDTQEEMNVVLSVLIISLIERHRK